MNESISASAELIPVISSENVVPDPGRLIFALRQIGYSLEQALSDLVDNSVSAGAGSVLIRFVWHEEKIISVAVVDDGSGMSEAVLREAMRFGSAEREDSSSLGKFGLGLKLASFSHARRVAVITGNEAGFYGRAWSIDGIRRNWDCDVLDGREVDAFRNLPWSPIDLGTSGTIISLEQIDKLPISRRGLKFTLRAIHKRLSLHLGLHFHRFLQSGALRIFVDQQEYMTPEHQIRAQVDPLDPFAYPQSGASNYPKSYSASVPGVGSLSLVGHIWPPNSELAEYRLGNRAAAAQGFYFYRNNRLIQAGGWNGLVQNESEPHSSLARVSIDLPIDYDSSFNLNVQKSAVIVPPGFVEAVEAAKSADDTGDFEGFRRRAQQVYRSKDARSRAQKHISIGKGIPASLQRELISLLDIEPDESHPIDFRWADLNDDEFFRLDPVNSTLLFNEGYRAQILAGLAPSRVDVPLLKLLVLFLVAEDLKANTISVKRRRQIRQINKALLIAAKLERG